MQKLFTIFMISLLILTGCSVDWNDAKDKKIGELNSEIANLKTAASNGMILFEKQTRCGALAPDIQTKVDTFNKEYANLGKFSNGGIFYSPVKDACLWIRLTDTHAPDGSPLVRQALYQYGDDVGATEPLIGCEKLIDDKKGVDACMGWDKELKRLKGEGL